MEVLSKDKIEALILPYLSEGSRGSEVGVELWRIVSLILYRLKTGCQWRMLPVDLFFEAEKKLKWQGVYYHYREWIRDGSFKKVWTGLLQSYCHLLDLSSVQLDGSQTLAKNGGEHIGYQGRKAGRTTNALFLCDNEGLPLSVATPQSGHHHDLHDIQELFEELCSVLTEAGIPLEGVFLNADSGFDAEVLQKACVEKQIEANININPRNNKDHNTEYRYFDEELYKKRFVVERMNAWLDSFKALLVRFETKVGHWLALHFLAFTVLLCRKIKC